MSELILPSTMTEAIKKITNGWMIGKKHKFDDGTEKYLAWMGGGWMEFVDVDGIPTIFCKVDYFSNSFREKYFDAMMLFNQQVEKHPDFGLRLMKVRQNFLMDKKTYIYTIRS